MQILIPAYRSRGTLLRAVKSLASQVEADSISILIGDDSADDSMTAELKEVSALNRTGFKIEIIKNNKNLGPFLNIVNLITLATEPIVMLMPHDDYLIDPSFISRSLCAMSDGSVGIVVGNTIIEHSLKSSMAFSDSGFIKTSGESYISGPLWTHMHPAYSGVVLRLGQINQEVIRDLYFGSFDINRFREQGFSPDEGYLLLTLIALQSDVAITGKIVSVRGNAQDTYSKGKEWRDGYSENITATYYNLYAFGDRRGLDLVCGIAVYLLKHRYRNGLSPPPKCLHEYVYDKPCLDRFIRAIMD